MSGAMQARVAGARRQAWFIRGAKDRGVDRIPDWVSRGYVSIGWEDTVHVRPGMSRQELKAAIARAKADWQEDLTSIGAGHMNRFFNDMSPGDRVVTVTADASRVYVGTVVGEPQQRGSAADGAMWQREVAWLDPPDGFAKSSLPATLTPALGTQWTITNFTPHLAALEEFLGETSPDDWDAFLYWAQLLYEHEAFDLWERDYKLAAAEKLSQARSALEADESWLPLLATALGGENNLVNWRARKTFLDWCAAAPEAAASAIRALWEGAGDVEAAIDAFSASVTPEATAGNRVTIASVLLLAVDPLEHPPFRPTADWEARRLLGISARAKAIDVGAGPAHDPESLATALGVSGTSVRAFLRRAFPRAADELDAATTRAVVDRFSPSASNVTPGARYGAFLALLDEFRERMAERGTELRDRLDAQGLVWSVATVEPPEDWDADRRAAFRAFQGKEQPPVERSACLIPPLADELAARMYLPLPWLQEAVDLLNEKRQVIFYGPPGTGKTFVAQALGAHVAAAGGQWQLVQFHPAYSYEDFFEGYRPSQTAGDAGLQFDLRKGPLRRLADEAAANPGVPYLLVIDEINRGNIAKIFGELYFLLEYRDRPIGLQYSPEEPFCLPENIFVVGTMNTADRSIALVDSALRRRFYFYPFLPRESPVREVLGNWLAAKRHPEEPALLLRALNDALHEALPDDEFAIGPSYFIAADGPPNLERVWRYAIRPLLEERFYGSRRPEEIERDFGLAAMRQRVLGVDPAEELADEAGEAA